MKFVSTIFFVSILVCGNVEHLKMEDQSVSGCHSFYVYPVTHHYFCICCCRPRTETYHAAPFTLVPTKRFSQNLFCECYSCSTQIPADYSSNFPIIQSKQPPVLRSTSTHDAAQTSTKEKYLELIYRIASALFEIVWDYLIKPVFSWQFIQI